MMSDKLSTLRITIVGDFAVGKSNLALRYVENTFDPSKFPRRVYDVRFKALSQDGIDFKLMISYPAGQERFRVLNPNFYRGSLGFLFVYDCTRADTFSHIPRWMEEADKNTYNPTVKMLIGNKIDLDNNQVAKEEGLQFAKDHGMLFMETSAKTGEGVSNAFDQLVETILQTTGLLEIWRSEKNERRSKFDALVTNCSLQ